MPHITEKILVIWIIGLAESPILLGWKGEVSDIEPPSKGWCDSFCYFELYKRSLFPAEKFETDFLSKEGSTKYIRHHQYESGGNAVRTPGYFQKMNWYVVKRLPREKIMNFAVLS